MTELTTKIGAFDSESRSVPVTFTSGDIKHERRVNAVLKDDGSYDKAATKERVAEVARGVAHKIGLGVITMPPPEPEMPAVDPSAE
ncbi:hypothetical protein [Sphingobium sp. 15-1]|uniref:hypothetical protein n=1 Tax=Sphingobium sp. 15-1 TaxID=2729616 RepID=UPI00159C5C7C|nr:hypothetical protein [Sphingobium sp. 15-1]